MKNCDKYKSMWVYAYRKHIPSQDSDHTQAVERFFGVLKTYEKQQFGSRLPLLEEFIPLMLKALQVSFSHRKLMKEAKRPSYFHQDPAFREALEMASWHLNSLGMNELWKCTS